MKKSKGPPDAGVAKASTKAKTPGAKPDEIPAQNSANPTQSRPAAARAPEQRRARGFRALAQEVGLLTAPLFARRGLAAGTIVTRWADVVGPALAVFTIPERISFARGRREDGTLAIRVEHGALAVELQHLAPQLIERVNGFFGYRAVERVKLTQGPLPKRHAAKRAGAELPPVALAKDVQDRLEGVADAELRAALTGLAQARAPRRT